jgi:DNA polymerase-1
MKQPERLFLLDGMALAYRAYFAFIMRPLTNSKGENTSAVYGFITALMKILEDERPEHVAVVFDTREPTFRHKMYSEYKATRQKMPEDMASQMEKLKDVVRAFNTPLLELPGYEADDIIGTLAKRAENEGVMTYMVTGDKDFMQLISPWIKMYKPGKSSDVEIIDETGVLKKFGVTPGKVIDVLGLIGDKSDNVPGVPGIGEKTAIPLVQKYGSIPELYDHINEIPQKGVREKLLAHREKAWLSRRLVTIDTNVPLDIDFHKLRATRRDTSRLIKLFGELEFKALAGRLRDTEPFDDVPPPAAPTTVPESPGDTIDSSNDEHQYHCVTSAQHLETLASRLTAAGEFVFDTETTSTNPFAAVLVGLSFCMEPRESFYVPVTAAGGPAEDDGSLFGSTQVTPHNHTSKALALETVLAKLKPVLENPAIKKVGQNIKYDMLVLRIHGVEVRGVSFDTMVASYVLRADGQHNLDALAMQYFRYRMISFEDLVGKGRNAKHITQVPLEDITDYSAEDADITMRVFLKQRAMLEEMGLLHFCDTLEFPLIPVLERMEGAGIALDVNYLGEMSKDLERQIENSVREILGLAGGQFNINSTQQLGHVLFNVLKLRTIRKTKTGFSTDVNVLEGLRGEHPIIEKLLDYRQLTKLKSTYVDALPLLVNPGTGRVHTSFNQTVAATGRLSGSDPNLQNIPIRTELGRAIRKAFVAGSPADVILSADYSQIELRVMAHISGDEGLREAFLNKEDVHTSTASKVFGIGPGEVTRDMRRKAKEVNFGIMYGIGPFGLANRLEISQLEAREIISKYFERFPKVKQYINDTIASARRSGYVSTLLGRRRYLPDINSRNQNVRGNAERQAINMPIQGTAADMIKLAMIRSDNEIQARRLRSKMLLQVHDELVFEVPETEIPEMKAVVTDSMQRAMVLSVPVEVEIGTGKNWLDAH